MAEITDKEILDTLHLSSRVAAEVLLTGKSTINDRRRKLAEGLYNDSEFSINDRLITVADGRKLLELAGEDPDDYEITIKTGTYGDGLFTNQILTRKKVGSETGPAWPVIQQPAPIKVKKPKAAPSLVHDWKTAVIWADTQFGFRQVNQSGEDIHLEQFHDNDAIDVAWAIIGELNPHKTIGAGDIIDLPSQSRWAQEAGFALTTQRSLDECYMRMAQLRDLTSGEIDLIEGNHDKRLQGFIETNALSAFGLRKSGLPTSWPVMSLPNLLRLDELDITYHDAYPAAHVWVNDVLKVEHGTKANANGSTMQRYLKDEPHFSRAAGHSHRLEVISRTTYDRAGRIQSFGINPGCLCRVDGTVPSFHSAVGSDGRSREVFEDWQQGISVVRYTDTEIYPQAVPIVDGKAFFEGQMFQA